jgi:hypothetical protein
LPEHDRLFGRRVVKLVGKAGNIKKFKFEADLRARFDFSGRIDQDTFPSVSPAQQKKFQTDFVQQFKRVKEQLSKYKWLSRETVLPPRLKSGPCRPPSDFHVFVSDSYDLSRALVPAWRGQRGWMEFPAHRVVGGEATIAHELVHVLFPNGNRMLAEGLAVYLQNKLFPRLPVFPNYLEPFEKVVQAFLSTLPGSPADGLWNMDLDGLESISTPDDLYMRIGARPFIGGDPANSNSPPVPHEVKFVYAVAGSLVRFLLENPIEENGLLTESNFGALYQSTPLLPLERDSGAPDRWQRFYKAKNRQGKTTSYSFKELGLLWKTYMHSILFSGGKPEIRIPDRYRKLELVTELYGRLTGIEVQTSAKPAAGRRRKGK